MFTRAEEIMLRNYVQEIINRPRSMEEQHHTRQGVHLWCDDWEIIEILKYLFNGHNGYMGDPPPNRLKNNPLWSKEGIAEKANKLIEESNGDVHKIILKLKCRRVKINA